MQPDKLMEAIRHRVRDSEQEARIRKLGEQIEKAFERQQAKGVKEELGRGWDSLKKQFDASLKKLQKDTGLY